MEARADGWTDMKLKQCCTSAKYDHSAVSTRSMRCPRCGGIVMLRSMRPKRSVLCCGGDPASSPGDPLPPPPVPVPPPPWSLRRQESPPPAGSAAAAAAAAAADRDCSSIAASTRARNLGAVQRERQSVGVVAGRGQPNACAA